MSTGVPPALALLRGAHVATLISLLGTLWFIAALAPANVALQRLLRRLALFSACGGLVLGIAWLAAEVSFIAGATGPRAALEAIPSVIADFAFARLLSARLVLLVVLLVLPARVRIQVVLAAAALGIEPWLGHAAAMAGELGNALIASELVHLFAAAAWLGALLPLLFCLAVLPVDAAASVLHRFTWFGIFAVLTVTATGFFQGWVLAGGLVGLGGTPYGRVALIKAALLAAAVVLASLNGLDLTRRLARSGGAGIRRRMLISIGLEAVLGLLIILTAGWLASLAPGVDLTPAPIHWGELLGGLALPAIVAACGAAWLLRPSPFREAA